VAVYARAIALYWWGPDTATERPVQYNRTWMAVAVLLLAITLLGAGIWPRLLGGAL